MLPQTAINYYDLLQINPQAEIETIERVYRILASRYHPDNLQTGDEERFKVLNEAYQILRDPVKRKEYDRQFELSPAGPLPVIPPRSIPRWAASFRATGVLRIRSPMRAAIAVAGVGVAVEGVVAAVSGLVARGIAAVIAAACAEATSIQATWSPTAAWLSTCIRICVNRPVAAASISTTDFSVSTSSNGSPATTLSPTFFSQRTTLTSSITRPTFGITCAISATDATPPA